MNKILLDTSVIIDFLRRKDRKQTLLFKLANEDLYISILVHTELYAGKSIWKKTTAKKALEKVLSELTILPLDIETSQKAGEIKAYHHNASLIDCIIAATAQIHKLHLASFNMKDFAPIENLKLYEP